MKIQKTDGDIPNIVFQFGCLGAFIMGFQIKYRNEGIVKIILIPSQIGDGKWLTIL